MKKQFCAVVMTAIMALSLVACGSSSSGGSDITAATTAGTVAEGSSSAQVYKLGTIGPLTGEAAIYGQAVARGAQIAVEELAASGSSIQFEINSQDDEADGEKSKNAYNNLMDWGMQVLVGPTTTGASLTVSDLCFDERTYMLTPSASSFDVVDGKDNVFQVCFTDPNQGVGAADYIAASEELSSKPIAVIYRNDDAYSQGIEQTFKAQAEANSLEVVYEGTFTADTATDFTVQLTSARDAGAELIFLPIYYQPASVILNQAASMGYEPTFFGVDGMDGILTLEGFDISLAEGVMLLTPFSADAQDEKTQNFVKLYQEKFGEVPNQFAADAYDAVYIIVAALEAAGCTADMSTTEICEALVPAMTQISVDGVTGSGMTWSATGEVSKAPTAVVIKDGEYVLP